ncbi:unnamed protein product [Chironomus riparius]|uniref:Lipocalin/cytosolic fatty-acid binding domain-containing protein n=1 Tax=Chironomus riparius TaxID=315576 RepID=A0A9N9RKJ0_9DIPT|nr:unnamed protein product [Chironomus riparius]
MSSIFIFLAIAFVVSDISVAQQPLVRDGCPDSCSTMDVRMSNDKLAGIWYLHASIPRFFEEEMKCTYINVTELEEDHLYFVKHEFNNNTNEPRETFGAIEFAKDGATNIYYTDLFLPFAYDTIALSDDYWVLTTCNEHGFYSSDGSGSYAYIFTRLQYPPCEMNSEIVDILGECGIDKDYLMEQDQNSCSFC